MSCYRTNLTARAIPSWPTRTSARTVPSTNCPGNASPNRPNSLRGTRTRITCAGTVSSQAGSGRSGMNSVTNSRGGVSAGWRKFLACRDGIPAVLPFLTAVPRGRAAGGSATCFGAGATVPATATSTSCSDGGATALAPDHFHTPTAMTTEAAIAAITPHLTATRRRGRTIRSRHTAIAAASTAGPASRPASACASARSASANRSDPFIPHTPSGTNVPAACV